MSTTEDASVTPGTQSGAAVERLSLPTFAPVRNLQGRSGSHTGSSTTSGSRWSTADRRSHSPLDFRAGSSPVESEDGRPDRPIQNILQRRNQNRTSGGFLLEPTTHSSRLSKVLLSRSQKDVKGKRKSETFELSVPKRRDKKLARDQGSSVRSSPLSVEVPQDLEEQQNAKENNYGSVRRPQGQTFVQNGHTETPGSQRSTTPSVGFDTDPAQIVDMALRLSEGRRRQASGRRFVSGDTPGKRVISTASSRQLRTPTQKLGQFIASPNVISTPPLPDPSTRNGISDEASDTMVIDDPFASATGNKYNTAAETDVEISRATASRVEKAKVYLELAYEHRRLLSHLPPLQSPKIQHLSDDTPSGSKSYNPLQYARNRKLRIREKSAIDAEAEGWHDVEKVRAWVDAVIDSHSETNHDPLECVRLPPLSLEEDDETEGRSPKQHNSPRSPKLHQAKARRPKSDWVTHPGDLIADAVWLEQGLNKTKIQDRDNKPIFPANTPFKFSGWRKGPPIDVPERLQQPTPPKEEPAARRLAPPFTAAPELPTFRSAHKKEKDVSRGRKRSTLKNSLSKSQSASRRRRLALLDSSSDSGSESDISPRRSDGVETSRGRKKVSKEFILPEGDPFGRPVSHTVRNSELNGALTSSDINLPGRESKRSSVENSRLMNYLKRNSVIKPSSRDRGRSRGEAGKRHIFRHSKDFKYDGKQGRSSTEGDSTAPDSPIHFGLPSIAINLDAPASRSPSPTKKTRSSLLKSLKDKSKQLDHERVETTDFAKRPEKSHSRDTSLDAGKDSSAQTSRGTSPLTRGRSSFTNSRRQSMPQEEMPPSNVDHRASTISRQNTRLTTSSAQDHSSRIRGMFKGGRIAELVGNEVSRVGEFIWKRDVPPAYRHHMSGSDASIRTYDPSDTDEDVQNGHAYRVPSWDPHPAVSTQAGSPGRRSQDSPRNNEKPQLHNPNLPSFISPFQRDREKQDRKQDFLSPGGPTGTEDHISRQVAQHRNRSKSPRLNRLSLPKLDTGAPQSVGVIERKNSYGFGSVLTRSQSASRAFNNALNASKSISAKNSSAGLSSHLRRSMEDGISTHHRSNGVDRRDITRVEALLVISAVKAKNISASYEQIPAQPSQLLLRTIAPTHQSSDPRQLTQVSRRNEYVFAARNLMDQLAGCSDQINDQLHSFTDETVAQLQKQIQVLEDQIENTITPRVRIAADSAGELSVKLTTTSTQAVKSMQDTISEAFRLRRRGPFRWLRLLWYSVIEWFVVGLLWLIWAIVTVIRIHIGSFKVVGRTIRWLLWID